MDIMNFEVKAEACFDRESVEKLLHLCEDAASGFNASPELLFKLRTILHELVMNSLEHGYKKDSGVITVSMSRNGGGLLIEVEDQGRGFSIKKVSMLMKEDAEPGYALRGRGLLIVKGLCSEMDIAPNNPRGTKVRVLLEP